MESRLAACAQVIGPISSHYRWKGELEHASEHLLLVKTTVQRAADATAAIVEAHPYDVPEVLVTPVVGGHRPYLEWVTENID